MNCYRHNERPATKRCAHCGKFICEECSVKINGNDYCKECVPNLAKGPARGQQYYERPEYMPPRTPQRSGLNSFLLFCFSCIPGLNYMYLGLMKRGMFFMTLFFGLIFVVATLEMPLLLFALFIEMCYSFFDGFKIRRQMLNGINVEDNFDDVKNAFYENKRVIIVVGVVAVLLSLLQSFVRIFSYSISHVFGGAYWLRSDLFSLVFGVIIILVGCYIIGKAARRKDSRNDEYDNQQR